MAREIEEEIQCRLVRCTSLGIETTQSPEGDFTVHTFLCDIDGEPQIPERERHKLHALGWYTFAELETMAAEDPVSLVPNVRAMLGQLKALLAA
jgi:8-oxo-dGTP pyrophosphatase MutT (NUDIX family)